MAENSRRTSTPPGQLHKESWLARLVWAILGVSALGTLVWGACIFNTYLADPLFITLLERHGPALVGVPVAFCISTVVTSALRALDGMAEYELFGLHARVQQLLEYFGRPSFLSSPSRSECSFSRRHPRSNQVFFDK